MTLWTVFTVVEADILASDAEAAKALHAQRLRRDGHELSAEGTAGVAVPAGDQIVITDLEIIDVLENEPVSSDCCDGTGFADYASIQCPNPDCPVPVR